MDVSRPADFDRLEIEEAVRPLILGENAARPFGIDDASRPGPAIER